MSAVTKDILSSADEPLLDLSSAWWARCDHTNASADQLRQLLGWLRGGDRSLDEIDAGNLARHWLYEIEAAESLARSGFAIGDAVAVAPPWHMGAVAGDGGTFGRDYCTGVEGRLTRWCASGTDAEVTSARFADFVPVSRLLPLSR